MQQYAKSGKSYCFVCVPLPVIARYLYRHYAHWKLHLSGHVGVAVIVDWASKTSARQLLSIWQFQMSSCAKQKQFAYRFIGFVCFTLLISPQPFSVSHFPFHSGIINCLWLVCVLLQKWSKQIILGYTVFFVWTFIYLYVCTNRQFEQV